jgi:hypothetical protein
LTRPGEGLGGWSRGFTRWAGEEEPLEIEGVPAGGAEIRFWAHGCRLTGIRVDAGAGPGTLLESVTMERASRRVVIVVDDQGRPVEGADLALCGDRPPPVEWNEMGVVTNAEGRAIIEFPVEAATSLYVGAEGRAGVRHAIEPGDEPIRVRAGAPR